MRDCTWLPDCEAFHTALASGIVEPLPWERRTVLNFQFPKDVLAWIEAHQGTAAWVQALGAVLAIGVAVWIARTDTRRAQAAERRRAQGLAILLHTEMVDFRYRIITVMEAASVNQMKLQLPRSLVWRSADLHLLGSAGGHLLQMMSTLTANNRQIDEMERLAVVYDPPAYRDLRRGIIANLQLTRDACDEAIAGLDRLIAAR
jgi:hypothetical protein